MKNDPIKKIGITLLTLENQPCAGCEKFKNMLKTLNVPFVSVDAALLKGQMSGIQKAGMPQLYIDGERVVVGSPPTLEALRKKLNRFDYLRESEDEQKRKEKETRFKKQLSNIE